jgi:enamine deaminase RidA (YjgF/YER057c/UK114 family)
MDDRAILDRIAALGTELPSAPVALAAYVPVRVAGDTAYVAGQIPMEGGHVMAPGRLGEGVHIEDAAAAARQAALQALSSLRAELGSFSRLRGIVHVTVYVAATPDFVDHPKVANGASEVLVEILGEAGKHARAAVGMASLPLNASVEVSVTVQLEPEGA